VSDVEQFPLGNGAVSESLEERLTAQFYAWEKRGRGWQVWDCPVDLEPPFRPFFFHSVTPGPVFDDARKPTFWSSLVESLRGRVSGTASHRLSQTNAIDIEFGPEDLPGEYVAPPLVELQVALRPETKIGRDLTEQFLLTLGASRFPLGFEVVGLPGQVIFQLAAADPDQGAVRQQLAAFFPEARVTSKSGFLVSHWNTTGTKEGVIVECGLAHEFMRPLKIFERFESDPLFAVAGALADVEEGELALLQVLFKRTSHPWAESILRSVTDWDSESFFVDAPEMISLAQEKVARPLFSSVIRAAAQSPNNGRAWEIVRQLVGTLEQFCRPMSNELIPLMNDGYRESEHEEDLLRRQTRRSGILLNSEELISLVHLSTAPLRIAKLRREEKKTKRAPATTVGHELLLGENVHEGKRIPVTLSHEQRVRHIYIVGASGSGKSHLLANIIRQSIENGEGVGVLDPHGDLIDQITGYIPENRFNDVILFDPSDEVYPVGFNILSAHSEVEKNLVGSDLVAIFRRLSTSWGDQMGSVFANAILAFLESDRGGTLADLKRFLVEEDFREDFLATVRDPEVVYYWEKEFSLLKGKPQAPILTRLDSFLRPKLIRHMVSQKENRLDFRKIMDERKIFLAKLAQGAIGEANAYLLGALLVSKFHQVAMGRQDVAMSERPPFYLHIDEFHHFITPSMASVLSGARKYHLGLVLAHQELHQLWSRDTEVANAVISQPATRICFRLGDFDAKKLAAGFSVFEAEDLQNLGVGEAIARVDRAEYDFNLKTLPLPKVDVATARARRERLIALSRERYARKREDVEAELGRGRSEVAHQTKQQEPIRRPVQPPTVRSVSEPPQPVIPQRPPSAEEPVFLGRGGRQHRYLQELIRRWAEGRGYRVTIEKQILGGLGSVDVALEREGVSLACEISVTSSAEQELGNIEKCLAGGFERVCVISTEKKALAKMREFVVLQLGEEKSKQVEFFTPDELFIFLESLDAKAESKQETVRGYKVNVQYRPLAEVEKTARKQAISQVIFQAVRRLKGKKNDQT
jgi:hypothetical protein